MKNVSVWGRSRMEPPFLPGAGADWSRHLEGGAGAHFFCWTEPRAGAAFFKAVPAASFWQAKKESLVAVTKHDLQR